MKGVCPSSLRRVISVFFKQRDFAKFIIFYEALSKRPFVSHFGSYSGDEFGILMKFIKFGKTLESKNLDIFLYIDFGSIL